jgi:hypothetical protein
MWTCIPYSRVLNYYLKRSSDTNVLGGKGPDGCGHLSALWFSIVTNHVVISNVFKNTGKYITVFTIVRTHFSILNFQNSSHSEHNSGLCGLNWIMFHCFGTKCIQWQHLTNVMNYFLTQTQPPPKLYVPTGQFTHVYILFSKLFNWSSKPNISDCQNCKWDKLNLCTWTLNY